jgi:hypothetical protein
MEVVKMTMMGAMMLGRIWRPMMRESEAPIELAART